MYEGLTAGKADAVLVCINFSFQGNFDNEVNMPCRAGCSHAAGQRQRNESTMSEISPKKNSNQDNNNDQIPAIK